MVAFALSAGVSRKGRIAAYRFRVLAALACVRFLSDRKVAPDIERHGATSRRLRFPRARRANASADRREERLGPHVVACDTTFLLQKFPEWTEVGNPVFR